MTKSISTAALVAAVLLSASGSATAASTINSNVPAVNSQLASAPIRGNFAAAANDVNNILSGFAAPIAPSSPSVGQFWRNTSVSPQIISQWTGATWAKVATFDITNGRITPFFGSQLLAWQQLLPGGLGTNGQCLTSTGTSTLPTPQNCVSATTFVATAPLTWNSSTLTAAISLNSSFAVVANALALATQISAAGPIGTASTVPVITYNQYGQLTAVSTATITPAAIGAPPNARQIIAGTGLSGGGDLSADRTLAIASTIAAAGPIGSATATPVVTFNAQGQLTAVSAATIAPPFSAVTGQATLAQLPTIGASTVLGSVVGGTPVALTQTQLTALLNPCTTSLNGAVPAPGSASGKVLSDSCTWITVAGTGTVTSVSAGTGMSFSTITGSGSVAIDKATTANYYAAASNKVVTADTIYPSEVTITYGATTTIDFSTLNNGAVTLTGNIGTLTLSNVTAGKAGTIRFIQDVIGSRTWPAGGNTILKYAGGTLPSLTTTANAVDVLNYSCVSATYCEASLAKDVRNP